LSNFHEVPHKEFEIFNSAVSPGANVWVRVTLTYHNDLLLHEFMHATLNQMINKWDQIHSELGSFHSELVVRRLLANKND
jgi:hypothetical protein